MRRDTEYRGIPALAMRITCGRGGPDRRSMGPPPSPVAVSRAKSVLQLRIREPQVSGKLRSRGCHRATNGPTGTGSVMMIGERPL